MFTALGRHGPFLLAISAALALGYGVIGRLDHGLPVLVMAAFKASCIVALAVIALQRNTRLLAAGLMFGAAGDALLALETQAGFLAGASAFLMGHLFYIACFLRDGVGLAGALKSPMRVAGMAVTAAAASAGVLALLPPGSPLLAPLGLYTAVLAAMTIASFTLGRPQALATVGGVLFFVSDAFVALDMFHRPADPVLAAASGFTGWIIYWAGQAGICVGALQPSCRGPGNPAMPRP